MSSTNEQNTAAPFILRWGIIGCGGISSNFVKDLVLASSERKVFDVAHAVTACGSRSISKAEEFITQYCPHGASAQKEGHIKTKPVAKGSYHEVYTHEVIKFELYAR